MNIDIQTLKQRFGIIGSSPLLIRALEVAVQVAPTDMSVLIMGESGVGKESFPKIIHQHSARKHGPYIAVNCGAIPEGTIDSELFGHLKGSFTGAVSDRKGYFQEADGGTIFLDEVGELPLSTQARLLRVLEVGEFIPVGASQPLRTNVRIVAATNVQLKEAVERGKFREDLLFRLNTVPIEVPPLRKRPEDIPLLFRYFAAQAADKYQMPALRLEADAVRLLQQYYWPGNIRELRNLAERISVLESERHISADVASNYLPDGGQIDYRPALRPTESFGAPEYGMPSYETIFASIKGLRDEVAELRAVIHNLLQGRVPTGTYSESLTAVSSEVRPMPTNMAVASIAPKERVSYTPYTSPAHQVQDVEVQFVDSAMLSEAPRSLDEVERDMIASALARHNGKRRQAAQELGISERTLYRKIKEYELDS